MEGDFTNEYTSNNAEKGKRKIDIAMMIDQKEPMRKGEKGGGWESERAVEEDMALANYYCFLKLP